MTKADLKAKWGSYCDTDKLVDDTMALLTKYNHRNTEHGVCSMLDTYFTNKQGLIDLFKKSDYYVGDMRIIIDIELERTNNKREIRNFCDTFPARVDARPAILKYVDEDGKKLDDYVKTGVVSFKAKDLLTDSLKRQLNKNKEKRDQFMTNGSTRKSNLEFDDFCRMIYKFGVNSESTLRPDVAEYLKQYKINGTFVEGMKTSRAFNRVCTCYGVNNLPGYNKLFASYSDMVSGLKRKLKFFISLNPLDYLTMSFGNSWASCHTIDKRNTRGMPNDYSGAYCGGTVSYMLDGSSIITYVHDSIPTGVEEGKIYRCMFHYSEGTLIQGRIYPQGNDGATDLYKTFRGIVQDEIGSLIGLTNKTWIKKSGGCGGNTRSSGVHYQDYNWNGSCNVSYPSEKPDAKYGIVNIGHRRVCPYCGEMMNGECNSDKISHGSCEVKNENL